MSCEPEDGQGAQHSPRDANCLCRARRDCRRLRSSFTVSSMWLALRELSAATVCCGQEGCQPPGATPSQGQKPTGSLSVTDRAWTIPRVTQTRQRGPTHGPSPTCPGLWFGSSWCQQGDRTGPQTSVGEGEGFVPCLRLILGEMQAAQLLHPHVGVSQLCHVVTQGQDAVGTTRKGHIKPGRICCAGARNSRQWPG